MPKGVPDDSSSITVEEEIPTSAGVNPDLLMWEMDATDSLAKFRLSLSGMYYDSTKSRWIKVSEPLANSTFVNHAVGFLADYMSKDKILTDLDEETIMILIRSALEAMTDDITAHHTDYDIKSVAKATVIMRRMESFLVSNLNRSLGGRTLDHQKPMIKRIENVGKSKEDSMWNFLPFTGR